MKSKRNKLTNFLKLGILFFGISLLLFNCEQRELTEEIETVSIDNKYQSLTMEDAIGFLNNFKSKGYSKKSTKGINLDIDINSLNLEEVENSDLSMPVFEATTKHIDIESKVFLIKVNDSLQGFLINRIPEKEDSSSNFSGMISITDLEGRFINGYRVEDDIFITQFVKKKSSKNSNFSARMYDAEDPEDCDESLDPSSDFCDQGLDEIVIVASGGNSSNGNTGLSFGSDSNSWGFQSFSFPNTGSGGSVRGPSSSSNSANVFPCDDPIHGCDKMPWAKLVKNLNITNQRQIEFLELKPSVVSNINNFLSQNNNSTQARNFVKEAINALINGAEVDFNEAYIATPTPDDNYVYQGYKQNIPNSFTLSNGDIVNVTFVTYTSDNKSSNQKVAVELVNSMKFTLEQANSNLSSSDKITSINVYATTNGHGTQGSSNHLKASAVDINSINGKRMALTGLTNQISELQKGFDNFQYIRENFGPYFKHKFSKEKPVGSQWNYNYPIGGHKDHIHISIRK